jgi:hypothetical protein
MKYTLLVLLLVLILAPIPTGNQIGAYNIMSKLFYCTSPRVCLHEKAHYIDYNNGSPSQSDEFRQAATVYIFTNKEYDMLGLTMREIYAEIYAGGNMDMTLKQFYPPVGVEFVEIKLAKGSLYYGIHYRRN